MNALQAFDFEQVRDFPAIIGVDEAGRGALAGPVFAAACVLREAFFAEVSAIERTASVNDSKQVGAAKREELLTLMVDLRDAGIIDFAVAQASVEEINERDILGATVLAMRRALEELSQRAADWRLPEMSLPACEPPFFARVLVDGPPIKRLSYVHDGIVKGDSRSISIGMASIAAKVGRDEWMRELAGEYPGYGLETHKGYGTKAHREAILERGPCAQHRPLFIRRIYPS